MGESKNSKAINALNNKEQRWMRDLNHKISRQLINLVCRDGPVGLGALDRNNLPLLPYYTI
jgi:hypothetical protein